MTRTRGPWTVHDSRTAYENPWMKIVEHDVTHPDGKPGVYGVMTPAHVAVAVVPLHADGSVTLVDYGLNDLPQCDQLRPQSLEQLRQTTMKIRCHSSPNWQTRTNQSHKHSPVFDYHTMVTTWAIFPSFDYLYYSVG